MFRRKKNKKENMQYFFVCECTYADFYLNNEVLQIISHGSLEKT